jgi:hypothetical protein
LTAATVPRVNRIAIVLQMSDSWPIIPFGEGGEKMIRITVDALATKQLREIAEPCEIYDPAGNKLGSFQPAGGDAEYIGYECPLSDEELCRIERDPGGRPLAEILRDLESGQ